MEAYGIDWDGPLPQLEPCESTVDVPETQSVLSDKEMFRLLSLVDPLALSDCHGIDLYMQKLHFRTRSRSASPSVGNNSFSFEIS